MARRRCAACRRAPASAACARCRAAAYCGPACQRAAWSAHGPTCARVAPGPRYESIAAARAASARPLVETRAVRVIDGDTIVVEEVAGDDRAGTHVRFDGVDAPEVAHNSHEVDAPGGAEARALIEALVPRGARVWLGIKPSGDRYGRIVADIWALQCDGASVVWLQEALLYGGYAQRLSTYDKSRDERERARYAHLDALAAQARTQRRGLYVCATEPLAPHDWRHGGERVRAAELERARECAQRK